MQASLWKCNLHILSCTNCKQQRWKECPCENNRETPKAWEISRARGLEVNFECVTYHAWGPLGLLLLLDLINWITKYDTLTCVGFPNRIFQKKFFSLSKLVPKEEALCDDPKFTYTYRIEVTLTWCHAREEPWSPAQGKGGRMPGNSKKMSFDYHHLVKEQRA